MADIKISELGAASAINNTDIFPMTSAGITVKATAQQIKNYMGVGNLADLNTTDKSSTVSAINEVNSKADKCDVLVVSVASFNSLPQTVTNENIDSDMVVVNSVLGTPSAQTGDWTVTASNGSLTISGTSAISGSTTATLYLMKSR